MNQERIKCYRQANLNSALFRKKTHHKLRFTIKLKWRGIFTVNVVLITCKNCGSLKISRILPVIKTMTFSVKIIYQCANQCVCIENVDMCKNGVAYIYRYI